jgi:hypothetical protein
VHEWLVHDPLVHGLLVHDLLVHDLLAHDLLAHGLPVHVLLVHDLLVHVPGTISRGPGASRDAASSGDTGDAAYRPRSRAMAGSDQPIGFIELLVVLPLHT